MQQGQKGLLLFCCLDAMAIGEILKGAREESISGRRHAKNGKLIKALWYSKKL